MIRSVTESAVCCFKPQRDRELPLISAQAGTENIQRPPNDRPHHDLRHSAIHPIYAHEAEANVRTCLLDLIPPGQARRYPAQPLDGEGPSARDGSDCASLSNPAIMIRLVHTRAHARALDLVAHFSVPAAAFHLHDAIVLTQ